MSEPNEQPVKLVTKDDRDSKEVLELLEDAIKYVREYGVPARCVVIGMVFERPPRSKFSVKFMGLGVDLLALCTRIPNDINKYIDEEND
jgi:hypothetical protein